jgi:hypothetical protein
MSAEPSKEIQPGISAELPRHHTHFPTTRWTLVQRHLADRTRHDTAQKRGGGKATVAFESMEAEERYSNEPKDHRDPEQLFARAWARGVERVDVTG